MATTKKVLEIEIDVDSGDVKSLNKEVEGVAKSTEKAKKSSGGLASGFKKISLAAAGIGAALAIFTKLADLLGKNQKVLDIVDVAMTSLSIVIQDLFNFIVDNYETVSKAFSSVFEDPMGSLEELGTAIQEGLIKRFNQFVETLGIVGKAIKQLFEGDFAGAWETAKEAAVEAVDIITGEENGLQAIKDTFNEVVDSVTNYTKSVVGAAQASLELNKQAEIAAILQQGVIEDYDRQAELLRQIRDDETKTFAERIAANEELGKVLKDQIKAQIELIDIQQKSIEDNLRNGLIPEFEAKKRLLELENERKAVLATVTGLESEQLINKNSLLREQQEAYLASEKEIRDIIAKWDEEDAAAEKKRQEEKKAADKIAAEEAIALAQRESAAKQQIQTSLFAGARLLAEGFGKQNEAQAKRAFNVQKALGIAEATINTGKAVTAALTAGGNPIKLATGLQFIEAAAAGVAGAVQIATIAKQKFNAGGGGSGVPSISRASAPTAASQAPQFNTVGTSGFNQLNESINSQNKAPIKAYVVSGEVSSAQSLDRNRIKEATFP